MGGGYSSILCVPCFLSSTTGNKEINFVAVSMVIIQVYVVTTDRVIVFLMTLTILMLSVHSFQLQLSTVCVAMDLMTSSMSCQFTELTMLSIAFRWAKIPTGYSCVPLLMLCTLFSMVLSCIHWSHSRKVLAPRHCNYLTGWHFHSTRLAVKLSDQVSPAPISLVASPI